MVARYESLLAASLDAETFVRRTLGLLEADFREMSLLALADWERLGLVSPELFPAVAALKRPSWGSWNGLLGALRNARKAALRAGDADTRRKVEGATLLARILAP